MTIYARMFFSNFRRAVNLAVVDAAIATAGVGLEKGGNYLYDKVSRNGFFNKPSPTNPIENEAQSTLGQKM